METSMHIEVPELLPELVDLRILRQKAPTVVFCMTFDAKGLDVTQEKWCGNDSERRRDTKSL